MAHTRFALLILVTIAAAALTVAVGMVAIHNGFGAEAGVVLALVMAASLIVRLAGRR